MHQTSTRERRADKNGGVTLNVNQSYMRKLTRARVAVSATFAMVGGGGKMTPPPSNSKTRIDRRPGDTAIDSS